VCGGDNEGENVGGSVDGGEGGEELRSEESGDNTTICGGSDSVFRRLSVEANKGVPDPETSG
jgi:hypothetical protein